MAETERVALDGEVVGPAVGRRGAVGRVYRAALIRPGAWKGKGLRCSVEVLRRDAGKFSGLASFLNPPPPRPGQHGHPMLERLLGVTEEAAWDEEVGAVVADYRLADTDAARWFGRVMDGWLLARAEGRPVPEIGLSAVPWVKVGAVGEDGMREVLEIASVEQVDAVYRPAAGGEFLKVLNGVTPEGLEVSREERVMEELEEVTVEVGVVEPPADRRVTLDAALRETVLEAKLLASGLPVGLQALVRESLPEAWDVEGVDRMIGMSRKALADMEARRTVRGIVPQVSGMLDGLDRVTEAFEALVEGRNPKSGVRPLSGVREAYLLLSGDYEMTGRFWEERVQLANVNSTTMANIVANVLNKIVVNEFQKYPRWWAPIVRIENLSTLQQVKFINLGGIGSLPAVAEGAAYTELTWDDGAEVADWQKRGGYLGLTLEAMDKDDVGRLRNAPRALAQAAWLTLGKSVSAIFTANSGVGPAMSDGLALFHSSHGNLGTTALSTSSWPAAKLAMRKQTELNSGERLGGLTAPKHLLVPPDLENTALTVLASENLPGQANWDVNPEAEGNTFEARMNAARRKIIVVDLWTDTSDWAAVADPQLYPTIGVAFRYGETPEIFSVASPASGLMFTNDVMPVKVRWFYATAPMDYRGLYKANVA